jgi:hypothetical protein
MIVMALHDDRADRAYLTLVLLFVDHLTNAATIVH